MKMPLETRIRWSGLLVIIGLAVLLLSLVWAHPLSFMAFLVVGCPLIVGGVLFFLWALAVKDGVVRSNIIVILIAGLLPFVASGCSGSSDRFSSTKNATPVFDPSSATARVYGTVAFEGETPKTPPMKIGSGDQFCKMNALDIFKHEGSLTEGGAIRNVIIYVRSGYEGRTYKVPEQPVVLDQQRCVYLPRVLTLMKGQKLKILNSDPTFHNVHAQGEGRTEFNIPQPSKGAEDIQTFSRAAMPFRIGCDFHTWMVSYAGVFEHPFHTTSNNGGKYELRLPPGKYEIVAWHEKLGEKVATLDVSENAALELNFKFDAEPRK